MNEFKIGDIVGLPNRDGIVKWELAMKIISFHDIQKDLAVVKFVHQSSNDLGTFNVPFSMLKKYQTPKNKFEDFYDGEDDDI